MITSPTTGVGAPVVPSTGALQPLGIGQSTLAGGFWGRRQETNAAATIPHIRFWLESEGWLPNFDLAAEGRLPEGRRGREFADSEVYKYLEALAWEIGRSDDPTAEAEFRGVVARVAAAQDADGYLNTEFGRAGQADRWSDLENGHELYCLGHLFQAAVARERTRPGSDDGLLGVAMRAADLVCEAFGADGIQSLCGHPEIEPALVELGRVTGRGEYLEQARIFVERRGHGTLHHDHFGAAYFQEDIPVREATVLRGHAVRANYLSAGAVDVAIETSDDELLTALERQWAATVARRTYVTGGQGSQHLDEAFGEDWMLPPDRAYSETCAAVGSVMFAWRLLLATGDVRYADLIERSLYNVVATSPSEAGTEFFYSNTLHRRTPGAPVEPGAVSHRDAPAGRAAWYDVSCCPPNVARTFASLSAYVATVDDGGLQLHQYASGAIRARIGDDREVGVDVETAYPADGLIAITISVSDGRDWSLALRIPAWAAGASLTLTTAEGTERVDATAGYAKLVRAFEVGDRVELRLPVAARITAPSPMIDATRGAVAVERGPEVLCVESVDLPAGVDLADLRLDREHPVLERDGRVFGRFHILEVPEGEWPYGAAPTPSDRAAPVEVELIPYHEWSNRGSSAMRVWLPLQEAEAVPVG